MSQFQPGTEAWMLHGGSGVQKVRIEGWPRPSRSQWMKGQDVIPIRKYDHHRQAWCDRRISVMPNWLRAEP